jgi:cysteine synthase A
VIDRSWIELAVSDLRREAASCPETPLLEVPWAYAPSVRLFLKDESAQPSGSLKHRLARELYIDAICNGQINAESVVIEASSGSTAISAAYFARILGLRFIAVVPRWTSPAKLDAIVSAGGEVFCVDFAEAVYTEAERLVEQTHGHYLGQFQNAARVASWTNEQSLPAAFVRQLAALGVGAPDWFVVGAGTGGTSATIGRYARYSGIRSKVCLVDPVGSVFADAYVTGRRDLAAPGSKIEGLGPPRVEPSFVPSVIDRAERISNRDSIAGMLEVCRLIGRTVGPSTGTAMAGALRLAGELAHDGRPAILAAIIGDHGARYSDTYYDPAWVHENVTDEVHTAAATQLPA